MRHGIAIRKLFREGFTRVTSMSEVNAALEHPVYNYKVVRQFAIMTVVWGIVGMFVGVYIAAELVWPALNSTCPGPASDACGRCTRTR
jgi:hypothetical protein